MKVRICLFGTIKNINYRYYFSSVLTRMSKKNTYQTTIQTDFYIEICWFIDLRHEAFIIYKMVTWEMLWENFPGVSRTWI